MSFLAPLFLLGGLAIGLPIVFHLIRRTTRERTVFSSLMFLTATPPRLTKRSRLEHVLLLLLRCTVISLLAIAFARPFLKRVIPFTPASGQVRHTIVLMDTSASMRRADLWSDAEARLEAVVRDAAPSDAIAAYTFDRQLKSLWTFEDWQAAAPGERSALIRARLRNAAPGWNSTALDSAVIGAVEMLAEAEESSPDALRQVLVLTDAQEGSRVAALQSHEWPKGITVALERLAPKSPGNAALQLLPPVNDSGSFEELPVRVRVSNAPDSRREQFEVGWQSADSGDFVGSPLQVYVPAGQSRVVSIPAPAAGVGANRLALTGDDAPFDNRVFAMPPVQAQLTIFYFGEEAENDPRQPLYFLKRAFPDTHRLKVGITALKPDAIAAPSDLGSAALLVATSQLHENQARALREAVLSGATLLLAPVSATAASSLNAILDLPRSEVLEQQPARYAMLGEVDFRHPLFAPFADARFSDFTRIHFWKYRDLEAAAIPEARVLARFDEGAPALFEVPLGRGRVVVLTSGWHPADSQLALSSKFVPLMHSMLQLAGSGTATPGQYVVGDPIRLPEPAASGATLKQPDGSTLVLEAGTTELESLNLPGSYTLTSGGKQLQFAVNLDPVESRTAPLPADVLDQFGAPGPAEVPSEQRLAEQQAYLQNAELESRQKLWRWLIVATLVVLFAETWLAGWTGRRNPTPQGATS